MARRKKPRVVWLPPDLNNRLGQAPSPASNPEITSSHFIAVLTGPPLGDPAAIQEFPVVLDQGNSGLAATDLATRTLADIEDSGYRLRRIVGKLFFGVTQSTARLNGDVSTIIVTAGFIVRRVSADGVSLAQGAGGALNLNVSPSTMNNIVDPWIWRRSWILSNLLDPVNTDATVFPNPSTTTYGSVADGPHVDAKTARIVGPEERLFLSTSVEGINGNAQSDPLAVLMIADLRVLGSMRTSVGNRRNASR